MPKTKPKAQEGTGLQLQELYFKFVATLNPYIILIKPQNFNFYRAPKPRYRLPKYLGRGIVGRSSSKDNLLKVIYG